MTWHPLRWLAKKLVPEAKPREASMPPPPSDISIPCNCEQAAELEKMEREVQHAFKSNDMALLSSARQTQITLTAEARSRRMLEGLMQRMDKGTAL